MDAGNLVILTMLAQLAQNAGQLDRAERAYRTLLISVRRESAPEKLPIGPTEILFELARISSERGQAPKAKELIESALESLAQNDYEADRVQEKLRERGEHELLTRVLDTRLPHVAQPHKRAAIFAQKGDALEARGAAEDAFAARLEAIKADPGSPLYHDAAWHTATAVGAFDRYVSVVEALLADERADDSQLVRCELLLRLGEVLEKSRNDLERAAGVYKEAAATGVRQVDVWRAQARVAGARGDDGEQMRLLGLLASLGEDQAETRADALYRMAEVQLASADTLAEGVTALERALEDHFRGERAAIVLRRAADAHASAPAYGALLDAYDRVARRSEDPKVLMHYLEKRALSSGAAPEQVREAAELADKQGNAELTETLMERAAELGRHSPEALAAVDWALLGLAERRMTAGDLAGAVKSLSEAAEAADPARLLALAQRVAEAASAPEGDLTLAAKLYERLLERVPGEPAAWGPLAEIYAKLGDLARLEHMVDETLDALNDSAQRIRLRMALARALLGASGRGGDAVDVLQAVLLENPEHAEAQGLLIEHLEREGRGDELIELLSRQLEVAQERRDVAAIRVAALRLGARLQENEPARTIEMYRRALDFAVDDVELLAALLERLGPDADLRERAELTEKLARVEAPAAAGQRCLQLCRMYDELGDSDGAVRALRLGAERSPDDADIRAELQARYRESGDWAGLCAVLLEAAERAEESARVKLWREVAALRRDQLHDAAGAAELFGRAVRAAPGDTPLCIELAEAQSLAGDHDGAVGTISAALTADPESALTLLVARARLHQAGGHLEDAIADLEHAFELDPTAVAAELEALLDARRMQCMEIGDETTERTYTLRIIDVLLVQGKRDDAGDMLRSWTHRMSDDVDALRRLRDIDSGAKRWEDVAVTCQRLVLLESGPDQIRAALTLAQAYAQLGTPEQAQIALEQTHEAQPDEPQVRAALRDIYEQTGDRNRLASLLVKDAHETAETAPRAELLRRAGRIFLEMSEAASAVEVLREAVQLAPEDGDALVGLVDAYVMAGWYDDAGELLDSAIAAHKGKKVPEVAPFYQRKARVAEAQGDHGKQLQWLQEAHNCARKNGTIAAELADLAEQQGNWEIAKKALQQIIALVDADCPISKADAFYRQGRIALRTGDDKNARMWARRARREDPQSLEIENFLRELGEKV
jgi:tetratricopeptide (TPR) repeat protein